MILNNCVLIGLTGGIGTGKSTVSKMIVDRGYIVIDADKLSREVVEIGKPAYKDIVEAFGLRILLEDKTLNRKKLARLIFSSNSLRRVLNNIIHPRVFEAIRQEVQRNCFDNKVIFIDMPLLFEVYDKLEEYDLGLKEIWLIYTDKDTQIKRLIERDSISEAEALLRINTQLSLEEKRCMATQVIDNTGDLVLLEKIVEKLLGELD